MPELPEVETVRRTLSPLVGRQVVSVWHSGLPLRLNRPVDIRAVRRACVGAEFERIERLGKYLLLYVRDRADVVVIHLGMSGRLRVVSRATEQAAHTHIRWILADSAELQFSDPRRFGLVSVARRGAERAHSSLAKLGIDPLLAPLSGRTVHDLAVRSRQPLKTFLLDQRNIAGIGNIYACEALWLARLPPQLTACSLSRPRAAALARAIPRVLGHALDHGGTSLRDFVNGVGDPGSHRDHLLVYDREGQLCRRRGCLGTIQRTITQGRATFYCPTCQVP
jgi:formamidopyrimidine-DNA glycosylase